MTIDNPYQSPRALDTREQPNGVPGTNTNGRDYLTAFRESFKTALLIQCALTILAILVLDFGQFRQALGIAILCQWALVCMVLVRRPHCPSRFDLAFVRCGIVPVLIVVIALRSILL